MRVIVLDKENIKIIGGFTSATGNKKREELILKITDDRKINAVAKAIACESIFRSGFN